MRRRKYRQAAFSLGIGGILKKDFFDAVEKHTWLER